MFPFLNKEVQEALLRFEKDLKRTNEPRSQGIGVEGHPPRQGRPQVQDRRQKCSGIVKGKLCFS